MGEKIKAGMKPVLRRNDGELSEDRQYGGVPPSFRLLFYTVARYGGRLASASSTPPPVGRLIFRHYLTLRKKAKRKTFPKNVRRMPFCSICFFYNSPSQNALYRSATLPVLTSPLWIRSPTRRLSDSPFGRSNVELCWLGLRCGPQQP